MTDHALPHARPERERRVLLWFMMKNDPMYGSQFLANLGLLGVSHVYHHLYEYGTVSIFGAMSAPRRSSLVRDGGAVIEEALEVRFTFDERIDDAFSCARSLALVQRILEMPARHLGAPLGEPTFTAAATT